MIIEQSNQEMLEQHELYIRPGSEIQGKGFLGVRTEILAGIASKTQSIGALLSSFIGNYNSICDGFYQNTSMGNYCSCADGVKICGSHDSERISTSLCTVASGKPSKIFARFKNKSRYVFSYHTMIGHDVWLGSNVQIKNGLIIGHGAIVGAGAVVTKNIPPYAVVGGSPAKIIRMRFPDNEIERLLKSEWFTYDWQDIELEWGDRHKCIEQMEEYIASGTVPLLGDGFAYEADNKQLKITPAKWSLERQFEVSYGTKGLLETLELPIIKERLLQP